MFAFGELLSISTEGDNAHSLPGHSVPVLNDPHRKAALLHVRWNFPCSRLWLLDILDIFCMFVCMIIANPFAAFPYLRLFYGDCLFGFFFTAIDKRILDARKMDDNRITSWMSFSSEDSILTCS